MQAIMRPFSLRMIRWSHHGLTRLPWRQPGTTASLDALPHGSTRLPHADRSSLVVLTAHLRCRLDRQQRSVEPDILVPLGYQKPPARRQSQVWKNERAPVGQMDGMDGHEEVRGFAQLLAGPEVPAACITFLRMA